jgi:TonB family protein
MGAPRTGGSILRKFYILLLPFFLIVAAQGQSPANAPCENPKYPINGINNKPPVPPSTWRAPQNAVVGVDLTIDKKGQVKNAVVVVSGGRDADEAVLKAVRNWTYSPAICGSTPVEMTIHAKINLGLGRQDH